MEDNITEKFALLNLIKALQGFSAPDAARGTNAQEDAAPPAAPATPAAAKEQANEFNAMASILERHEAISNRVRQKK